MPLKMLVKFINKPYTRDCHTCIESSPEYYIGSLYIFKDEDVIESSVMLCTIHSKKVCMYSTGTRTNKLSRSLDNYIWKPVRASGARYQDLRCNSLVIFY